MGRLHADADRLYGWALQHLVALIREDPEAKQSLEELAFLHFSHGGRHLWGTRRLKDADRSYQAALEIFDKLALDFPEMPAYRARAAECRIQLGIVARGEGRIQEAKQNLRQGIQLAEKVVKELPSDAWLRFYLGCGYRWLADIQRGAGSPQEVEKSLVQGLAVLDKLVAEFPNNDEYLAELSRTCRALAEHHFHSGRTEEGRRLNQRAVELSEQVLANQIAPYRKAIELDPNDADGLQQPRRRPARRRRSWTRPSPPTARPSNSTRNTPTPTTTSASPCATRRSWTRPSPPTARPSNSTRNTPTPTTTSASPCATRRSWTRPSPPTARPSNSTRNSPRLTTTSANALRSTRRSWTRPSPACRKAIEARPETIRPTLTTISDRRPRSAERQLDEAVAAYRKAIELDPKFADAALQPRQMP